MKRPSTFASITIVAAFGLVACMSGEGGSPTTSAIDTTTTVAPRVDDGILRVGVLLPSSGQGAAIGQSARAAIRAAVDTANGGGGVNGEDVVLLVRDEGANSATATVGLLQLLESQIDVLIGPASSNITIALAPTIVDAGVVTCSPSASALALDAFPDNHLFFRTIPSDSLQAEAMAKVIEQTGDTTATIVYIDDGYGRPFDHVLRRQLQARGIVVNESVGFSVEDDEYRDEAMRVVNAGAGAIALIGDAEAGSRLLSAIAEATADAPRDIVLNDALRQPWSLSLIESVDETVRSRIVGVSPSVLTTNPELLAQINLEDPTATGLFAGQAFDCANLFMLAALRTGSTQPSILASAISDISSVGSSCSTYSTCATLIDEGRSINYEGADGLLSIGSNGDLTSARFELYSFDETGRDVTTQMLVASSPESVVGS